MRVKKLLLGYLVTTLLVLSAEAQTTVTTAGGTTNTVPVYTGSSTLGNSPIAISGSNVGIGTTTPTSPLQVIGPNFNTTQLTVENFDTQNGSSYFSVNATSGTPYLEMQRWTGSGSNYNGSRIYSDQSGNFLFESSSGVGAPIGSQTFSQHMVITGYGNVGIGTASPGATLEVNGNVKLTANSGASIAFADGTVQSTAYTGVVCGGDFAESVDVSGQRKKYEPGDVLVLTSHGEGDVARSAEPYSTLVAGIYSTKPGYVGRRLTTPKSTDEIPMAMIGIVPTKVSAENGPIRRGDLLVTASLNGYAMKGTDRSRMLGAVLGKAMGSLDSGTGVIEVLVTLQ